MIFRSEKQIGMIRDLEQKKASLESQLRYLEVRLRHLEGSMARLNAGHDALHSCTQLIVFCCIQVGPLE
jgi:hypothetical protein